MESFHADQNIYRRQNVHTVQNIHNPIKMCVRNFCDLHTMNEVMLRNAQSNECVVYNMQLEHTFDSSLK